MVTRIGIHLPLSWPYGNDELAIFDCNEQQIAKHFPDSHNLLINATWFGSQFDNGEWERAMTLEGKYDNLFLLNTIDPLYLFSNDEQKIIDRYNIKNVYRIGMFEHSEYEWNFHAIVGNKLMPDYNDEQVLMRSADLVYILYQRKPRRHRIEITNILREHPHLLERGIVTLGGVAKDGTNWNEGLEVVPLTIDDSPVDYNQTQNDHDDFGGVPNDLATVGRLDLWQNHFLNVVSETEFDEHTPVFVSEKLWKPIIGLRPFHVHGNPRTYQWLRDRGFRTFNHYWDHIPVEIVNNQYGQHHALMDVINWLCDLPQNEIESMYQDMLSDLRYNKQRFCEFSNEQKYKMENIFNFVESGNEKS